MALIERVPMQQSEQQVLSLQLQVKPLAHKSTAHEALVAVSFFEQDSTAPNQPNHEAASLTLAGDYSLVQQLEHELQITRQDLQSTIEEMETSNEELKASNEEVMSINEELQSTNEELETSKEELQSLNEELTTVNSQLQDKVEELERANNDITNLLNSSDIATLFLDHELRIKRFTPAATQLFSLIASDIGRPLTDLAHRIEDPILLDDAYSVLQNLVPLELDIKSSDERWFNRRVLPYRTQDNKINGVVVTFSDITRLRQSERIAAERLAQLEKIYQKTPVGLAFLDHELRFQLINEHFGEINTLPLNRYVGKTPRQVLSATFADHIEPLLPQVLTRVKPSLISKFIAIHQHIRVCCATLIAAITRCKTPVVKYLVSRRSFRILQQKNKPNAELPQSGSSSVY